MHTTSKCSAEAYLPHPLGSLGGAFSSVWFEVPGFLLGRISKPLRGDEMRPRAYRILLFWLATAVFLSCSEPPAPPVFPTRLAQSSSLPRETSRYHISARLDEITHRIVGKETIYWQNHSQSSVDQLYFHLYLNAFKKGSLFLSLQGGRSGGLVGREGGITVDSLKSPRFPGKNLWENASQGSPESGDDQTDISVPQPRPIVPGETVELLVRFSATLPEIVERTGFSGDFHLVAQWFPKLARLEDDGTFAHFAFHPYGEFYSDFDDYVVDLDIPTGYEIASTGTLELISQGKTRSQYRATAQSVVDFAWSAWPGAHVLETSLQGVQVRLLTPPGAHRSRRIHLQTLEQGLTQLGAAYGAYPYSSLTVVQPPKHAARAGGMEYPTFITTGGSELGAALGIRHTELLVIHELGHQWFQSLIATHEQKYPFLDEGLNSFVEWRYLTRNYGAGGLVDTPAFHLSRLAGGRFAAYFQNESRQPIDQPASDFPSFRSLSQHVYARTPLALLTLGRVYGKEKVSAALKAYARKQRGKHPTPNDFYRSLSHHLGGSRLLPIVRQLFEKPGPSSWRIDSVRTRGHGPFHSEVHIEQSAAPRLPYTVRAIFRDGSRRDSTVRSAEETARVSFEHTQRIQQVIIDPDRHLLIDENFLDNRYWVVPSNRNSRTNFAWTTFLQSLLVSCAP